LLNYLEHERVDGVPAAWGTAGGCGVTRPLRLVWRNGRP